MREIKFRAWEKILKVMLRVNEIYFYEGKVWMVKLPTQINRTDNSYIELMQFTGLKDQKGADIYEGDIVRMWWGIESDGKKIYRNHAIEFHSGKVGPCVGENVMEWSLHDCSNLWNGSEVEVIGNIYEHKDLLG